MKKKTAAVMAAAAVLFLAFSAPVSATTAATNDMEAEITTTTTQKVYSTAPDIVIADSEDETLGSITFRSSNSKRIEVGKVTTLYLTIKDMSGTINTMFTSSNTAIATVEKINNTSVKVTGLREGEVVITATAGGKSAKYTLIIGNESVTQAQGEQPTAATESGGEVDVDLFSSSEEYEQKLAAYAEADQQSGAGGIIIGLIGLAAIISGFGTVLSVMFSNRSPKLTLYPNTQRQFSVGGYRGKKRKRLLADHYYRNIKKY